MNKMYIVRKKDTHEYFTGGSSFHGWRSWSRTNPKIYKRPGHLSHCITRYYGNTSDEHQKLLDNIEVVQVRFADIEILDVRDVGAGITNENKVKRIKKDITKGKAIFNMRSDDKGLGHLTLKFMGEKLDADNEEKPYRPDDWNDKKEE